MQLSNGKNAVLAIVVILVLAVAGWYVWDSGILDKDEGDDGGGGDDDTLNEIPLAFFSTSHMEALVGENITFNAGGSTDPDGTVERFEFDFGDGLTDEFTREQREVEEMDMISWHNYTIANTYAVTLVVFDGHEPVVGRSDPYIISIRILPDDYSESASYVLSARAIDTKNTTFDLANDAVKCTVNVTISARLGVGEPSGAEVWLQNPLGDVIMNETASLTSGASESFGIELNPTQLSTIGEYELTIQCTSGRIQYSYDILIDY